LYVPGKLADTERVIVDVGTGFYVEKSKIDARRFYDGKVKDIQTNLTKLEGVVNAKTENLRRFYARRFCKQTVLPPLLPVAPVLCLRLLQRLRRVTLLRSGVAHLRKN